LLLNRAPIDPIIFTGSHHFHHFFDHFLAVQSVLRLLSHLSPSFKEFLFTSTKIVDKFAFFLPTSSTPVDAQQAILGLSMNIEQLEKFAEGVGIGIVHKLNSSIVQSHYGVAEPNGAVTSGGKVLFHSCYE
jgi:hypothetical protein